MLLLLVGALLLQVLNDDFIIGVFETDDFLRKFWLGNDLDWLL